MLAAAETAESSFLLFSISLGQARLLGRDGDGRGGRDARWRLGVGIVDDVDVFRDRDRLVRRRRVVRFQDALEHVAQGVAPEDLGPDLSLIGDDRLAVSPEKVGHLGDRRVVAEVVVDGCSARASRQARRCVLRWCGRSRRRPSR
jgi:hypothetical protein